MKKLLLAASFLAVSGISSANVPAEKSSAKKVATHLAEILNLNDAEWQQAVDMLMAKQKECREAHPEKGFARRECMQTFGEFVTAYVSTQKLLQVTDPSNPQAKFMEMQIREFVLGSLGARMTEFINS
jgi:hypothetical protein